MAIGAKQRFEILKRDGFKCRYCGAKAGSKALHVDHVHPQKLGGGDELSNLVTACPDCNLGKGAVPLDSQDEPHHGSVAISKDLEAWVGSVESRVHQVLMASGGPQGTAKHLIEAMQWVVCAEHDSWGACEFVESLMDIVHKLDGMGLASVDMDEDGSSSVSA